MRRSFRVRHRSWPPLTTATSTRRSTLLEHGADVNAKETNGGQTALMWAAANKSPALVRLLIDRGADVRARSNGGFTPLLFAAQQGNVESGRILLQAGADVNERSDKDRKTALIVATASGSRESRGSSWTKAPIQISLMRVASPRCTMRRWTGMAPGMVRALLHARGRPESPDHERLAGVRLCRREPDRRHAAFPRGVARPRRDGPRARHCRRRSVS